jgi:hypothetical protein
MRGVLPHLTASLHRREPKVDLVFDAIDVIVVANNAQYGR